MCIRDRVMDAAGYAAPSTWRRTIEKMFDYCARQMSANGLQVLNGDSGMGSLVNIVSNAAARFHRPDWLFLVTRGAQGQPRPNETGSKMFDWAGQLVMHSTWGASVADEALWAWFKVGPYGNSGHGHLEKLHLSVRAHGAVSYTHLTLPTICSV